jgi:hypothetical protein
MSMVALARSPILSRIWTLTISQAQEIGGAIDASWGYLTVTHLGDIIKHVLGIDFVAKIEEMIEKAVFGYSQSQVEDWGHNFAEGLNACGFEAAIGYGHPKNPHCWVYVVTSKKSYGFNSPLGFIGAVFEIPAFNSVTLADPRLATATSRGSPPATIPPGMRRAARDSLHVTCCFVYDGTLWSG